MWEQSATQDSSSAGKGRFSVRHVAWLIFALGVLAVAAACAFRPLRDFDMPWNLATGRWLLESGSIPERDDLAFTRGALRYVELIGDVVLYKVYALAGAAGLQLLGAAAVATLLGVLAFDLSGTGPVGLLAVAGVGAAVAPWFEVRPASFSFVAFALLVALLNAHRRQPARIWSLLAIVLLQLWWANCHGFATVGAAWIVGYAAYRALAHFARGRVGAWLPEADGSHVGRTALFALLAIGATCLNTAGPVLLLGPLRFDEVFEGVTEWERPTLHHFLVQEPVAAGLLALGILGFVLGREPGGARRPNLYHLGQFAIGLMCALVAMRTLPLALIIVLPLAALRCQYAVRAQALMWLVAAISPLLAAAYLVIRLPLSHQWGFDETWLPVRAADFIVDKRPRGQMYNFMPFGGYLALRLYPEYRVFQDGRNQLARSAEFINEVRRSEQEPSQFQTLLSKYQVEWAIERSPVEEGFGQFFAASEEWTMAYWDDVAAVYVRTTGPNASLAQSGYRLMKHLVPLAPLLGMAVEHPELAPTLTHDAQLAVAQAPSSPRAAFIDACAHLAARDAAGVEQAMTRLAVLSPGHPALAVLQSAAKSVF